MNVKIKQVAAAFVFVALTGCQSLPPAVQMGVHKVVKAANHLVQSDKMENQKMTTNSQMVGKIHEITSSYAFDDTVSRLENAIKGQEMTIFAIVDHKAAAEKAGMSMQPAKVIVFGAPKAGTPLMRKDPIFALQLPLKVLVTTKDDKVVVAYHDTRALVNGSNIMFDDVKDTLANAEKLIEQTVTAQ